MYNMRPYATGCRDHVVIAGYLGRVKEMRCSIEDKLPSWSSAFPGY